MQTTWIGYLRIGADAQPAMVEVKPTPKGLEIQGALESSFWKYGDIHRASHGRPGQPILLERGRQPVETLSIREMSFLGAVHKAAPWTGNRLFGSKGRNRGPLWAAVTASAVFLGIVAFFWGIPAVVEAIAAGMPLSWEEKLGKELNDNFLAGAAVCDDSEANRLVQEIVDRLSQAAPSHPYTFRVTLVKDPTINAMAAPGGYIVVFTGLLESLERAEELAGVLAHEMQHVLRHHGTKRIFRKRCMTVLLSFFAGNSKGMQAVMDIAKTLNSLEYSRKQEREADILAMELIRKAQIDPQGVIQFFKRMEEMEASTSPSMRRILQYLSTHPSAADRVRWLRRMTSKWDYEPIPLKCGEYWKDSLRGCL